MTLDDRIKEVQAMDENERESLCINCGICCYHSIKVNEISFIQKDRPCPFLCYQDGKSFCAEYDRRHELMPTCLGIIEAMAGNHLPSQCPYVYGVDGYNGKRYVEQFSELGL